MLILKKVLRQTLLLWKWWILLFLLAILWSIQSNTTATTNNAKAKLATLNTQLNRTKSTIRYYQENIAKNSVKYTDIINQQTLTEAINVNIENHPNIKINSISFRKIPTPLSSIFYDADNEDFGDIRLMQLQLSLTGNYPDFYYFMQDFNDFDTVVLSSNMTFQISRYPDANINIDLTFPVLTPDGEEDKYIAKSGTKENPPTRRKVYSSASRKK